MIPRNTRVAPVLLVAAALSLAALVACQSGPPPTPTLEEAQRFLANVNATVLRLGVEQQQASWVYSTYITADTEALNARADQAFTQAMAKFAKDAVKYDNVTVSMGERRQFDLLKLSLEKVTPADPPAAAELTRLSSSLEATYGRGKWCKDPAAQPSRSRPASPVRSRSNA